MITGFYDVLSIPSNPEDLFILTECLGHGAYGHVYKGIHKASDMTVAIKIIHYNKQQDYDSLQKEISLMKLCADCPYIVNYYGSYHSKNRNQIWIIFEYCDSGSTIDLISATERTYMECEIATIMDMILKALSFMHEHNLIHRDVKGANILLNSDGYAKLGDFGVGVQLKEDESMRSSKKGSPYWMSPQVVRSTEYDYKTDIWSLGVTCIELCEGEPPFSDIKPLMVMKLVAESPPKGLPEGNHYSKDFNDFVQKCLTVNPVLRPSANELLEHPFIKNYSKPRDYIKNLVKYHMPSITEYRKELQEMDKSQTITKLNSNYNNNPSVIEKNKAIIEPVIESNNHHDNHSIKESFSSVVVNDSPINNAIVDDIRTSIMVQVDQEENHPKSKNPPEFLQYINNDDFIFDDNKYLEIQNKKNDSLIRNFLSKNSSNNEGVIERVIPSNNEPIKPSKIDYDNNKTLTYQSSQSHQKEKYSFLKKYRNGTILIGNVTHNQTTTNSTPKGGVTCLITNAKGEKILQVIDTTQPSTLSVDELLIDKEILNESIDGLKEKLNTIKTNKKYEMECIKAKTDHQISKVALAIDLLLQFPNIKTIKEYDELYGKNNQILSTDYKTAHKQLSSFSIAEEDEGSPMNHIHKPNVSNKHKHYFFQ